MNESVARLAGRAAADPFFLAFALAEYAAAEQLDEAGLAAAPGGRAGRPGRTCGSAGRPGPTAMGSAPTWTASRPSSG